MSNELRAWDNFIKKDPDWELMRKRFTNIFYEKYNQGFVDYVRGDWKNAKINLTMAEVNI